MSEVRGTVEVKRGQAGSGNLQPRLVAPRAAVLRQTHLHSLVNTQVLGLTDAHRTEGDFCLLLPVLSRPAHLPPALLLGQDPSLETWSVQNSEKLLL